MATMMENNNTNEILKATSYAPTNIACSVFKIALLDEPWMI